MRKIIKSAIHDNTHYKRKMDAEPIKNNRHDIHKLNCLIPYKLPTTSLKSLRSPSRC